MKRSLEIFTVLVLAGFSCAKGQSSDIGIMAGASNYSGDLQPQQYTFFESHPAFSFMYWKELNGHFNIRAGLSFAQISGDDRYNPDPSTRIRNLSFHSNITEFQVGMEYNLVSMFTHRFSPYLFAGLGIFHFNPTTVDTTGHRVALHPLSTEGEGLPESPDQEPYSLTQVDIPMGMGLRYGLTNSITLGLELGLRVTFTDYLDDVSTFYVDKNALLAAKGPEAVEMAFRTNELPGYEEAAYPVAGTKRGDPKVNDFYYFTQFTISFRLPQSRSKNIDRGTELQKAERSVECPPGPPKK